MINLTNPEDSLIQSTMMAKRKYPKKTKRKYNHTVDFCLRELPKQIQDGAPHSLKLMASNGAKDWSLSYYNHFLQKTADHFPSFTGRTPRIVLNKMLAWVRKNYPKLTKNGN